MIYQNQAGIFFNVHRVHQCTIVVNGRNIIWKEYVVTLYPKSDIWDFTKKAQLWTGMLLWHFEINTTNRVKTKHQCHWYIYFITPLYTNSIAMGTSLYFTQNDIQKSLLYAKTQQFGGRAIERGHFFLNFWFVDHGAQEQVLFWYWL